MMSKDISQLNKLTSTLDVVHEKIDGINSHLKELNGKTAKNLVDIQTLKLNEMSIMSSLKGGKTVGVIALSIITLLIGTITSVSVYAYISDKKTLEDKTAIAADKANSVASELANYRADSQQKTDEIIRLLKSIVKK